MAVIVKEGKTYDPVALSEKVGVCCAHEDYYGTIKEYHYSSKDKILSFVVHLFGTKALSKIKDASPVYSIGVNINPNNFDEKVGIDGVTVAQCYDLALADPGLIDFKSDEEV